MRLRERFGEALDDLGAAGERVLADAVACEPTPRAQTAFNATVQRRMQGTVWTKGGCASWYLDAHGRNTTLWPGSSWTFRRATRRFDVAEYELIAPVHAPIAPVHAPIAPVHAPIAPLAGVASAGAPATRHLDATAPRGI